MAKKKDWRLGTILTELSFLTAEELESALKMTRSTGMPLGSVLLVTGALSKEELRAMIQAQSMLKDQLVDQEKLLAAVPLLKDKQSLGLEGALRRMKWHRDTKIPTNKLGELLVSAQVVSQLQLAKGLAHNRNSLQPLGRTLVLTGALSPRALKHALAIQERIRVGEISRTEGVALLRQVCAKNDLKVHTTVKQSGESSTEMLRLGDLLIEAGIVKEEEFSEAMEVSAYKSRLIGEILIECRMLSRARLQAALELQRLISMGLIGRTQAIAALRSVDDDNSVANVLEKNIVEDAKKRLLASEALTSLASHLTGLKFEELVARVDAKDHAKRHAKETSNEPSAEGSTAGSPAGSKEGSKEGSKGGAKDWKTVAAEGSQAKKASGKKGEKEDPAKKRLRLVAEHLYLDVLNGALDVEQAMIILNVCLKDDCSVLEAIANMGWTVGARPFRESEINYSDSDLIDWLTQEG